MLARYPIVLPMSAFGLLALLITGFLLLTGAAVYWPGFLSMIGFYAAIFLMGAYAGKIRRQDSIKGVMLAGRSLPLGIAIFTMSATWIGGGYVNGTAEYTFSYGLSWVQAPWGYGLSLIVGGLFFARKMRRHGFKTMLDPLAQRFGKGMGAVLFIPALTGEIFWTSAILTALGTTFGTIMGLDFNSSIILSAVIAIGYTALGGLWAVAITDVVQLVILLLGLTIVIPFAAEKVGGLEVAIDAYQAKKGMLANLFPPLDGWRHPEWGNSYWNWWDFALLLIFGGIPWQVYFQRVLAAKNEKTALRLSIIAGIVCMFAAIPPILIGIIADSVDWAAVGAPPLTEPSLVLPYVIRYLTPPIVATIGLGALAAAVMSSVDSSILSASSMASWNVYRPLFAPNISSEKLSKVIKKCIWIIGIAATLLALQVKSVYVLWLLCSDLVYTLLFPALVTALFDPKANRYGAIAGFALAFFLRAGGGEPALGLQPFLPYPMIEEGGIVLFPFRTLAMLAGLTAIIVVSRLTQKALPATPLTVMEDAD